MQLIQVVFFFFFFWLLQSHESILYPNKVHWSKGGIPLWVLINSLLKATGSKSPPKCATSSINVCKLLTFIAQISILQNERRKHINTHHPWWPLQPLDWGWAEEGHTCAENAHAENGGGDDCCRWLPRASMLGAWVVASACASRPRMRRIAHQY